MRVGPTEEPRVFLSVSEKASTRVTRQPRRASSVAAGRPQAPAPTTTARRRVEEEEEEEEEVGGILCFEERERTGGEGGRSVGVERAFDG